jgi:hypothetical protein
MKMEPIESSETSASNTQTPGIYPKESELHLQHGENSNLKSDLLKFVRLMELWFVLAHYRQVIRTFGMLALHGTSDQLHTPPVLAITNIQGWLRGL